MPFRNMFRSNYRIMKEALQKNDVAAARSLMGKEIFLGHHLVSTFDFGKLSPEMTRLFVRDMSDGDWQKWGYMRGARDTICQVMFFEALASDRADLAGIFTGADIRLNADTAARHPLTALCLSGMPEDVKRTVMEHLLAQGIDKVSGRDEFLKTAVAGGFIAGFDALKPLLGTDIHSDNEHMLRYAAGTGQADVCLHLVQQHGADIDVALITERTLGRQKAADILEGVRAVLKPEAKPAPTIAGLAAQVQGLEQTVAELRENMRDITARLDRLMPEKSFGKRLARRPFSCR